MNLIADTSVAVLAGGKSTRFGSPKIRARVNDVEFGTLIIQTLRDSGFSAIALVGGNPEDAIRWRVRYLQDLYPASGPLGALITALASCETEKLLLLPCDVPFIDIDTCRRLSELSTGSDVRVARTGLPQWLCSTWRISTREFLTHEFESGERAIHNVVKKLQIEFLDVTNHALTNINEPNQLKS